MDNRNIVCLVLDGAACVTSKLPFSEIASAGWQMTVASIEEAPRLLGEQKPYVGLIVFPENGTSDYNSWPHLDWVCCFHLAHPKTQWIALLSHQWLAHSNIRDYIFTHFYDYHTLPIDVTRLLSTLGHAYGMAKIGEIASSRIEQHTNEQGEIIGISPIMQLINRKLSKIAGVDAPILITGESGTGKELITRIIHKRSQRARESLVVVNCGALPSNLIQSELFGHEKGAFTGAHQRRIGRIETANQGTIFLDEIGDLPLDLQVNLLRVLQEGYIERLGSSHRIDVNVRVVAATNVNLPLAVAMGKFREDLYYRLNVLQIEIPPLRQRKEDIEPLAWFFLSKFRSKVGCYVKGFSNEALDAMKHYDWPGNVRELINRVQRAMVMTETRLITASDLELKKYSEEPWIVSLDQSRAVAEKKAIETCLRHTSHNIAETARKLKISRGTLYKLIDKFGINLKQSANKNDEIGHNTDAADEFSTRYLG